MDDLFKVLIETLKNEYGIESEAELDEELKKLGGLDISEFCIK